jgi:hypothetical protein
MVEGLMRCGVWKIHAEYDSASTGFATTIHSSGLID